MRRSADWFAGQEMRLLYVAKRLKEAQRLESVLAHAGIDYAVESDRYVSGAIFRSERVGAFFYVSAEADAAARQTLRLGGWSPFEE
jgi:hypothetical protein